MLRMARKIVEYRLVEVEDVEFLRLPVPAPSRLADT